MYSAFRPAARRLLSARPNVSLLASTRSRSITTQPSIAFINRPATAVPATTSSLRIQRRWNSDEANKNAAEKAEEAIAESAINSVNEGAATTTTTATTAEEIASGESSDSVAEADILRAHRNGLDPVGDGSFVKTVGRKIARDTAITPRETIYIGNLFFDITAQDLKARMEAFGVVTECNIVHDGRGLSKGFGYVTFESVDAATRAIAEMNQQIYEGRRVIVQYSASAPRASESRPRGQPSRTLYIGNLAFDLTDRELNDIFKSIRNVIEVRVAVDRDTGLPRGFAHVDFLDVESAQAAVEILVGKAPHGRRLKVDFSARTTQRPAAEQIKREREN